MRKKITMNKSTLFFIFILIILVFLSGYNYFFKPFADFGSGQGIMVEASPSPEPEAMNPVEQMVAEMTPEAKIAQLLAIPFDIDKEDMRTASSSATLNWIMDYDPGTVTLFGTNISTTSAKTIVDTLGDRWIAVDHEGGSVQRLSGNGFTRLPAWNQVCQKETVDKQILLETSAQELSQVGVDIVFAPVVDYGSNSILGSRICSPVSSEVITNAKAFIKAFDKNNIISVIKHFPGIGKTKRDLHTSFDTINVNPEDAQVYIKILNEYPQIGVMTSHVGVENQFADIPCSLSPSCVGQITTQYPQTLVFSDALDMKSVMTGMDNVDDDLKLKIVAKKAIEAGNDVLVFGKGNSLEQIDDVYKYLVEEYESDQDFASRVDLSVKKIIKYKND